MASDGEGNDIVMRRKNDTEQCICTVMSIKHRPLKVRTDGSHSRVRELLSIGIFFVFLFKTSSKVVRLLQKFAHKLPHTVDLLRGLWHVAIWLDIDTIDLWEIYGINIEPRPTCVDNGRSNAYTCVCLLQFCCCFCCFTSVYFYKSDAVVLGLYWYYWCSVCELEFIGIFFLVILQ